MKSQISQPFVTLNSGQRLPLLGLGVYDMHHKEAEIAVLSALEIGYRLIDTAAMYENEKEVGKAIRSSLISRKELFVTTKVNNLQQGYENTLAAFEESMKRLNIDYIDLYLIHWPIKGKRQDTWKALEKLYNEKQVKAIGVANYLQPFLNELKGYASVVPAVNQVEFTPFLYLNDLHAYCKQHHIQLQSYSPLTRGKKFNDPVIKGIANKYGKTPAQVLIRWNLEHEVSTIPKSSNRKRLQENFDVLDFVLSKEDMNQLDNLHEGFRVVDDPIHML
jgi:methylglyoxal/glyoxal reductase